MMGPRQVAQGAFFYEFSIEGFVPLDHPLRGIDRFLDLTDAMPDHSTFSRVRMHLFSVFCVIHSLENGAVT